MGTSSTNNGADNQVNALAMNGTNNLFVGGSFTSIDGNSISAKSIASWDGNSWNILGSNSTNNGVDSIVYALAMNGTNNLFVGGSFTSVNGPSISAYDIASWDGNSWNILGSSTINGVDGTVYALAMNGTNQLFVGGYFTLANGYSISANYIASWNGSSWSILGTNLTNNGVNGTSSPAVRALAMNGTSNLFVGGSFTSVNGNSISSSNIASWDGNSWNILGSNSTNNGINGGIVNALAMSGTNNLFVGGRFTSVDGNLINASNIIG